ncbi:MAG: asparaginase domain-containing protein [Lachnospiraceae bacterium]|nr:asparaginase domain-containing protein [Lachnospiraceae bacterium]
MNILFIFTGGTIGSRTHNGIISTESDIPYILIDSYKSLYGIDFSFKTVSPYTILSENSNGSYIKQLSDTVNDALSSGSYDGIIVAHGTDTLLFSADIISLLTRTDSIPICFVSSAYPPEEPEANALDNLHAAVNIIKSGNYSGTMVPYRNHDNKVYVHRPLYLLEAQPFNDELFSLRNRYMDVFDNGNFIDGSRYDHERYISDLSRLRQLTSVTVTGKALSEECKHILHINPFPGISYPDIPQGTRYILHESFHSGTINTVSENAKAFFKEAYEKNIPVYLTGVYGGASYESTKEFDRLHIIPVNELSPTAVYCRLMLG